jgi:hypothetical protein
MAGLLGSVLLGTEIVQKGRPQDVLADAPVAAHVRHRLVVAVGVRFDGQGDGVGAGSVDERRKGQDALVTNAVASVEADDASEVNRLAPERPLEGGLLE